ncbi:MAG: electron transfer flavoprotein subunit beta/FixA family protein [Chloroflexota bacterium]
MRIIVPIKQVPDMSQVKFDMEKGKVDRSSAGAEINPFDLTALEAAVQIKEKLPSTVTAISMGPPSAEAALRDALSRGAGEAILLVDKAFAGSDTLATSYTLAAAIKKLGQFDLIICGEKTVDGDTGQVGPEIAEHLNIPHVSYVSKIEDIGEKITVSCEMDGIRYTVESDFPLLITVTKDINVPRLPAFSEKMRARKAKIEVWTTADLASVADQSRFGAHSSPTCVHRVTVPTEEGRRGEIFRGIVEEAVVKITNAFRQARILEGKK